MEYRKKWKKILLFGIVFLVLSAGGCQGVWKEEEAEAIHQSEQHTFADSSEQSPQNVSGTLYIHVCGCVKNPGLYLLKEGARIGEAIQAAGGLKANADDAAVNLAARLEDGMQVYVPSKQKETAQAGETSVGFREEKININQAKVEELTSLSGIGESRAQAIIDYREENGLFSSVEDIKNVSGIGEGIFERIKNKITV